MKRMFVVLMVLGLTLGLAGSAYAANSALLFDGQNDYVKVLDSNSLDLSDGMTIEAWVNFQAVDLYKSYAIVSKWDDPTNDHSFILKKTYTVISNEPNRLAVEIEPVRSSNIRSNTALTAGNWIHVAASFERDNPEPIRLFINGVQDKWGTVERPDGIHNSVADLLIGAVNGNGGWEGFDGLIDEVRIWNYARTQQQLQDNMFYSLTGNESGLMAYWNFDEGSGQVAGDLTANGNNGQLGSTAGIDGNDPQWVLSDGRYGQARDVVPEPLSALLFGIGLVGLSGLRKKK